MNWDFLSSIMFSVALFGFYIAFVRIPYAMDIGELSYTVGIWITSCVVGASTGIVGSTLYRFFANISDIKMALQNISRK